MAADAITASSNTNLSSTTRDLWVDSVVSEVFMQMPLFAKLLDKERIFWEGGTHITRPVQTAEMDNLGQSYLPGEALTAGRAATLTKPWFGWKYAQLPVVYDVEEELQNGGGDGTKVIDFAEYLAGKSHRGLRIMHYKMMYDADTTDTGKPFQSVVQALNHDAAYGHVTRATTVTNKWWQGASIAESYADQDTARSASVSTFRSAKSACDHYLERQADYLCLVGPANYLNLKSQVDGSTSVVNPGSLVKYGFDSFTLDGVEIVKDEYLRASSLSDESDPQKWFFIINVNDWELRLHPRRSFGMTPFTWQGDRADGADEHLARIMTAGNLVCWRPNGSIWLSDVS